MAADQPASLGKFLPSFSCLLWLWEWHLAGMCLKQYHVRVSAKSATQPFPHLLGSASQDQTHRQGAYLFIPWQVPAGFTLASTGRVCVDMVEGTGD